MPANRDTNFIKRSSSLALVFIISGFALIVLISVGLLLPQYIGIKKLEETSLNKMISLEHQRTLFPIYAKAENIVRQNFETHLPSVERKTLKRDKITSLTKIFKQMAIKHQLIFSGNSLDIARLNEATDQISIELSLTGDLLNFRGYLISLVELEFFNRIERIKIFADQNNTKKFIAKININIDKR